MPRPSIHCYYRQLVVDYASKKPYTVVTHFSAWRQPMYDHHALMGGKLHLYRRENSLKWQCSTSLGGRNWRKSTKEDSFARAKAIAEDWYLELKGKMRGGELKFGKTFKDAEEKY